LTSWEKVDNKKIDKKLESEFEKAMQVIETGLKERDKAQIGLRWPLAKAEVSVDGKLSKDVLEIIARQLNVKSVALKRGKDSMISVKLDMKMTKELEAEGFAREISRKIQAERKQKGLKKGDLVDLVISSNEEGISLLKENEKFIKERTNSKTLKFVDDKNQKGKNVLTIKEKRFGIKFS
jgi:isoleucyl-tRNA synthetase